MIYFEKIDRSLFSQEELDAMYKVAEWINVNCKEADDKELSRRLCRELYNEEQLTPKNLKKFYDWVMRYEKDQGEKKELRDVARHVNLILRNDK